MGVKTADPAGWEIVREAFEGSVSEAPAKRFLWWVADTGYQLGEVGAEMVRSYGQHLGAGGGWRADTIQRAMTLVNQVWRVLFDAGVAGQSPPQKRPNPKSWELVVRCEREMQAEGRSRQAIDGLKTCVRRLLRYLEAEGIGVRELDGEVLYAYQKALLETRTETSGELASHNSVIRMMTGARMWCQYLVKWGMLAVNPAEFVKSPRGDKGVLHGLMKEAELEVYLETLGRWEDQKNLKTAKYQYRAHVLAELQYASGLRLSEVGALTQDDVDWERGVILVKGTKGGHERTAYLNEYALEVLKRWRTMRPLILRKEDLDKDNLFGAGRALEHTYNGVLGQVARQMGKSGWTSHKFRHALGYHLLRAGCKLRHIQAILGHEQIKTTEVYTKVDEIDTREVLDSCHPRGAV